MRHIVHYIFVKTRFYSINKILQKAFSNVVCPKECNHYFFRLYILFLNESFQIIDNPSNFVFPSVGPVLYYQFARGLIFP